MELSVEVWALEEKHVGAVVLAIFPGMLRGSRKRVLTSWLQILKVRSVACLCNFLGLIRASQRPSLHDLCIALSLKAHGRKMVL